MVDFVLKSKFCLMRRFWNAGIRFSFWELTFFLILDDFSENVTRSPWLPRQSSLVWQGNPQLPAVMESGRVLSSGTEDFVLFWLGFLCQDGSLNLTSPLFLWFFQIGLSYDFCAPFQSCTSKNSSSQSTATSFYKASMSASRNGFSILTGRKNKPQVKSWKIKAQSYASPFWRPQDSRASSLSELSFARSC